MSQSTALTTKVESGSPYQLSSEQTLKASKALLAHMKPVENVTPTGKQSLIASTDEEDDHSTASPIWLTLTTKKHIVDQKKLKPSRLSLPHPLSSSATSSICLITADPQRTYKDIVSSPAFPKELAARITKVVGIAKIRSKWTQYEAQRKLYAEHDIFIADDRIVTLLPKLLGKTFYKRTAKRPIPVSIQAPAPKTDGKRIARAKGEDKAKNGAGEPKAVAAEIEKAIQCALVHLTPSTSTAVKIGYAGMDAQKLADNVESVTKELIEKFVGKKWRGVRGVYIKGNETAALPIWLADELWEEEKDVLGEQEVEAKKVKEANVGRKRKAVEAPAVEEKETAGKETARKGKKEKKIKLVESNDDKLDQEITARKEKLKKQKADAAASVRDEVPNANKKSKKGKEKEVVV